MTNIKVTYESIVRRITISSTTTWSEIETQFRVLFNIPQEIPITVSYTDEEGDVITLSSDLELQEVLSSSSNNTIKFVITTPDRNNNVVEVADEETSSLIDGVSAIQIEESNNQQSSQETPEKTCSNNNTQENNPSEENQENNDDEPEIIVIITKNPWSHRRRERFGGCNPYYPYYNSGERSRHECHRHNSRESQQGSGRYYRRHQQISSEVVAEKINVLHSMGFVNDNLEELVKKYNGNLELIIEVLLFNQNNEKEVVQPMEVEEENRPYVL